MATPVDSRFQDSTSEERGGLRLIATCSLGLEELLCEELRELGMEPVVEGAGGVVFTSDWRGAIEVLLRTRIASRLLWSLRKFSAKNQAMLYDQVRRLDWAALIPPGLTIAVESTGLAPSTDMTLSFATLKIKDAICDEIRKAGAERPNVDRANPDALICAHFAQGRCEISLDLAGRPLHRRGYRVDGGIAPLRENRAAALLRFAGYDGSKPFFDAFCGSGTLVIEAALIAMRVAPGTLRSGGDFAFSRLRPDDREMLESAWRRARGEVLGQPPHPIVGRDFSDATLKLARANVEKAGLTGRVDLAREDARESSAKDGFAVSNPPYGERLSEVQAAGELIRDFASRLKHNGGTLRLALVLPVGPLEKAVGLRASGKLPIENGQLSSKFLRYDIYPGKGRRRADDTTGGAPI